MLSDTDPTTIAIFGKAFSYSSRFESITINILDGLSKDNEAQINVICHG